MKNDDRPILALGLRILSAMSFATMMALVKLAGESGVKLPEIMFWRQAVSVPLLLGWMAATGTLGSLKTARIGSHARRATMGMLGMLFVFGAIVLLPLAESTVLSFTTPLFAVVLGALVFRQHIGPYRWTAVALGFAGVLVTANPGGAEVSLLGVASGLAAALVVALVNHHIRDLSRTEKPITTVFYFAAFGTPMVAVTLPFFMTPHTAMQWAVLGGVGLFGTLMQLLMTASLRYGPVTSVIVMDYTQLVWATLFGWLIWEKLPPAATWLGAPLIVAAGATIAWREHRLARATAPLPAVTAPEPSS